jgi:hypothetical protein
MRILPATPAISLRAERVFQKSSVFTHSREQAQPGAVVFLQSGASSTGHCQTLSFEKTRPPFREKTWSRIFAFF